MGILLPSYIYCLGLIAVAAQLSTKEPCTSSKQQDIIIVLDSSTSIARADFQKQLGFVNSLIDNIDIGPDANQVGIISFSNSHKLNFHLNANREKTELQSRVSAIKQIGGNTFTHKPLEYLRTYMFASQRGDRPDKDNVCVVITDGQSSDPERTAKAAAALRDDGVRMFALGVGPKVDKEELLNIAGNRSRVFQAISYDELKDISLRFSETVLGVCPTEPVPSTVGPIIPPPIITGMSEEPVEVGQEISLRCSSETVNPDVELYWYRNGAMVSGTTYGIEGDFVVSYYSFTSRLGDDGRNIECRLRHPSISEDMIDSEPIRVIVVPGPPVITYNPGDTVYDGDLVTLACVSNTEDPLKTDVIWKVQGELFPGEKLVGSNTVTNNIVLQAALSDNSVRYACEVIHPNIPEPLIGYAKINVKALPGRPVITANPESPVQVGSRVSLVCMSNGTDRDTKVAWYRDNRLVDESYSISGSHVRNEMLVTVPSSREYECRVSHPRIDDMVTYYTLDVYKTPERPVIKAPSYSFAPGNPITLDCTSQNADARARLVWIKNGDVIDESYELQGSVISNSHTFSSLDDITGSRCEVSHAYLSEPTYDIPPPITTKVLPGPPIINNGNSIEPVTVGSRVELTCRSLGTEPETSVIWYRNGRQVGRAYARKGDYIENTYYVRASEGISEYECRVSHPLLEESLVDEIGIPTMTIPEPPTITGAPTTTIISGTKLTLTCQSLGTSPDTQLIWYKGGEEVDTSYSIRDRYVVNEYEFTVYEDLSNLECRLIFPPSGLQISDRVSIRSEVLPERPVITGNPERPVSIGTRVSVVCRSNGTAPGVRLTWFRDGRQVDISFGPYGGEMRNEYSYTVKGSTPETLECRLEYAPADLTYRTSVVISKEGRPGTPAITGVPKTPIGFGMRVNLTCQSLGTSVSTRLIWFKNGRELDSSYSTQDGYVINRYDYMTTIGDPSPLECRLEHQPLNIRESAFANIVPLGLPGSPEISGVPSERVRPGSLVQAICRSLGTANDTQLVWYSDGVQVDSSYYFSEDYVINEYDLLAPPSGVASLECRLTYAPAALEMSARADVRVQELPGNPTITGGPSTDSLVEGTAVKLVCASRGTSQYTELFWYEGDRLVDRTQRIMDGYVINEYDFVAREGQGHLECRMRFPPADLSVSAYYTKGIKGPDTPEIDQIPTPVWKDDQTTLICRVRHNGNIEMSLEWYLEGRVLDQSQYIDGDYIMNTFDLSASDEKAVYECRLTYGTKYISVRHSIDFYELFPHPIISGAPSNISLPGDPLLLTCTWPRLRDSASLYWVNPVTNEELPSTEEDTDPNKLVSLYSGAVDSLGLNVFDCRVRGVTRGKENGTLVDRVKIPVVSVEPTPAACSEEGEVLDIVFIIDSSTSVKPTPYQQQIRFLSGFASSFKIGPQHVQLGVVSFSYNDRVDFYMDDNTNENDLENAIANIKQIGGGTNTHIPLKRAREEMFTPQHGDRPDVKNLLLILTDGKSYNSEETALQAELLRDNGVEIYAIGVGTEVDFEELNAITGSSEKVYFAEGYSTLQNVEASIVADAKVSIGPCPTPTVETKVSVWSDWSACSVTCGTGIHYRTRTCELGTDGLVCPELDESRECIEKVCETDCISKSSKADIAFLLDTSSSVYEPDFDKMKLFLADFMNLFNVSETGQKIASLTFSDDVDVNFHFNDYDNIEAVKAAFLRIPMHLGGTQTAKAIRYARQELFVEMNGARRNSAKVAFVITDGKSYDPEQTTIEAELARRSGIIVYSIGIGPETDQSELERIAGEAAQVYYVETYAEINTLKRAIGVELGRCYNPLAPIDGGYGPWSEYSRCSVSCGVGTKTRTRECNSPVPRNGGKDCEGPSTRSKRCRAPPCCPPAGCTPKEPEGWSEWEFSSSCSTTCGEGVQEVTRYCQYGDSCQLGQVESKTIRCQLETCQDTGNQRCGGDDGLNVMFASQGINANGPNSYLAVELIANATASLGVDGNQIRTSLTLSDCSCGRNTGYDLSRYRNFEDIYNHLHDLDLGDTASLLRKVKSQNNIMPSLSRDRAFSDSRRQVLVYMFDANDYITSQAIAEANKMKLAGVTIYAAIVSTDVDMKLVSQIASAPAIEHILIASSKEVGNEFVTNLYEKLCGSVRL
ncbi:hemicentin-1-like [Watersipora subatra]|uniref:hemicentin-1-like n=1 Tax=Watersipora subatra TaxID=2589382 RepID=UPI00355B4E3B